MATVSILSQTKASLGDPAREAEIRKRRHYKVKSWPISLLGCKQWENLGCFEETAWPLEAGTEHQITASIIECCQQGGPVRTAMNEQQRNCVRVCTSLVDEVQFEWVKAFKRHDGFEVRKCVQPLFERSPAELILPVLGYSFDICNRGAAFAVVASPSISSGIFDSANFW